MCKSVNWVNGDGLTPLWGGRAVGSNGDYGEKLIPKLACEHPINPTNPIAQKKRAENLSTLNSQLLKKSISPLSTLNC